MPRRRSTGEVHQEAALAAYRARKAHVDALYHLIAAGLQPRTPTGAKAHRALCELHRVAKGKLP